MISRVGFRILAISVLCGVFISCQDTNKKDESKKEESKTERKSEKQITFQNKGHEIVYGMVQKVGNYDTLANKNSVKYTYTYQTSDGKTDVSTEMYMFDGELSYGKFETHERTLPQLEGTIEQGYDGNEFWLKNEGEIVENDAFLKRVKFNRPTNFYWFTMMQKLLDPGLNYEHLGEKTIDNKRYEVVKVTFETEGEKPTDIYQLYINKETKLVDQFLFTVADFGKMETPNLMQLEYEDIDGIWIPTKRKYKLSTWDAEVTDAPWTNVTWSDIEFDAAITKDDFKN